MKKLQHIKTKEYKMRSRTPKSGIIYLMTDTVYREHGYAKIGFTARDIRKRLSEANVFNPKKDTHMIFAKRVDNPRQVEAIAIKALNDSQIGCKGEWFKGDVNKMVEIIKDAVEHH